MKIEHFETEGCPLVDIPQMLQLKILMVDVTYK